MWLSAFIKINEEIQIKLFNRSVILIRVAGVPDMLFTSIFVGLSDCSLGLYLVPHSANRKKMQSLFAKKQTIWLELHIQRNNSHLPTNLVNVMSLPASVCVFVCSQRKSEVVCTRL